MTALFVFALSFAVFGIACGSYCLGCSLVRLVPALKLRQKKKDRP